MGIFSRRNPTPEEVGQVQCLEEGFFQKRLDAWHEDNPLVPFRVYYANAAGEPINADRPEALMAHRCVLEQAGDAAVFIFEQLTPRVSALSGNVLTQRLALLTVPYERVHSINTGEVR